jgi:Uma2 family endonuclease
MAQPAIVYPEQVPPPARSDEFVVLRPATWADYQRCLEIRGERSVPRLTYLEGVLELMTPSISHEAITSMIGRLVEAWCFENSVGITPYRSWTLESKETERGAEPDECYVLGDVAVPQRPDLAIEVIWTSGSVNKLEIYRKLQVQEVWIWRNRELQVYVLGADETYAQVEHSKLLPGIDLAQLLTFVDTRPMTRAVNEYRAALRANC